MSAKKLRVVHYLNQFFGGLGAEEKAAIPPRIREGAVGPGVALQTELGERGQIVATVICGDDYFAENQEQAKREIIGLIAGVQPDLVIAGPAFNAGRYGIACGQVCEAVQDQLKIAAVTAMYPENPGVEISRQKVYIVPTAASAVGMRAAIGPLVALGCKLAQEKPLGSAAAEGYIARGYRKNAFVEETGAERAVQMLLAKLKGDPFQSELPLPFHDHVPPAKPIASISAASIALVTEGGIVPKGNPDGIESRRATKWVRYSLQGLNELSSESHECVHGGFDTDVANEAPDRILPLDVMRQLENEGAFGKLFDEYFVTVGNSSTIANAKKYGREIAKELLAAGVKGVVFPAT